MKQEENYISMTQVVVFVLWAIVTVLMIASWMVVITSPPDHRQIGFMLALTGSTLACVAAVAHIRIYAIRTTGLIRVTAGLTRSAGPMGPSEDVAKLRSIQSVH